jgi:hypothetical protein
MMEKLFISHLNKLNHYYLRKRYIFTSTLIITKNVNNTLNDEKLILINLISKKDRTNL